MQVVCKAKSNAQLIDLRSMYFNSNDGQQIHKLEIRASEMIAQILNGADGVGGLFLLVVVCDQEGLLRLDDHDAFLSLDTDLATVFMLGVSCKEIPFCRRDSTRSNW